MTEHNTALITNHRIISIFEDRLGYFQSLVRFSVNINEYFGEDIKHTLLTYFLVTFAYMDDPRVLNVIESMVINGADLNKPQLYYNRRIYPIQMSRGKVRIQLLTLGATEYVTVCDISSTGDKEKMLQSIITGKVKMSERIDTEIKDGPGIYATYHSLLEETRYTPSHDLVKQILNKQDTSIAPHIRDIDLHDMLGSMHC